MDDKSKKYFLKGFGYLINQDYDRALDELKEVVMQNTHIIEMYIALGTLYRKKGEYLKAIHIHESAVGEKNIRDDLKKQVLHELVLDYKLSGQYDKALYNLNNLLKMDKSPVLYKLLATLYFDKGEYESAIKNFTRYSKMSKRDVTKEIALCYYNLAGKSEDYKKKIKLLKKSIEYFKTFRLANYRLLDEYVNKNERKLVFNQLISIIENDIFYTVDDVNIVSNIFFDDGKLEDFVKKCIEKVSKKNKNPLYHIYLSGYYQKKGDLEKAKKILGEYLIENKKVVVVNKYLELTNDPIIVHLKDELIYKCDSCGEKFSFYFDICPKCNGIQTLAFN
ncbi:hypothetical protein OWM07_02090 [Deferribacter thermophilus]|uniref:tetratricopeptide repeat protein n=1 Tax=Deferribacter thermophilus TaxID=53573 RepID=UPI003C1C7AC0